MNRAHTGLLALLLTLPVLLAGCNSQNDKRPTPAPTPPGIPATPVYPSAAAVAARLARSPAGCADPHPIGNRGFQIDCQGKPDGFTSRDIAINWFSNDFSDSQAARNNAVQARQEQGVALAVGSNWLVLADEARLPAIAAALGGIVIGVPVRPAGTIPPIPPSPQVKDLAALAAAVDQAIGCAGPEYHPDVGMLYCTARTGGRHCLNAGLFHDPQARDTNIAGWIHYALPAAVVTAGNWYVYNRPQGSCANVDLKSLVARFGGVYLDNGVRIPGPDLT